MFTLGSTPRMCKDVPLDVLFEGRQVHFFFFLSALMRLSCYIFCSLVMQKRSSNLDCSDSGWVSEGAMTNYEGVRYML